MCLPFTLSTLFQWYFDLFQREEDGLLLVHHGEEEDQEEEEEEEKEEELGTFFPFMSECSEADI